jgi:hypothetical protein
LPEILAFPRPDIVDQVLLVRGRKEVLRVFASSEMIEGLEAVVVRNKKTSHLL